MKTRLLLPVAAALALGAQASALTFNTNFEPAGIDTSATLFTNGDFSFHNGFFAPEQDAFGDDIPGSDQWQIDTDSDGAFPLQVIDTDAAGYGAAPSGTYALNGVDQTVLIVFPQAVNISAFSITLDNSTFGNLFNSPIDFVSGACVLFSENVDQSIPGHVVNVGPVFGVTAIVLPAGAYYDDLSLSYVTAAIPEPSSFAALAGLAMLGLASSRRRRA